VSPHAHHHHPPAVDSASARRRLTLALVITLAFVVVEAAAGLWANSLALLTDAAHNLTDVAALALAWFAMRLAARPADAGRTYGYHRAGILAALANSASLIVIALGIFYEAYRRLGAPPEVREEVLIGVGTLAFIVNLGTALMVRRGSEHDLNLRGSFVHLAGDALSTAGAVAAGIAIAFTGLNVLDPLVSVLIGLLIVFSGWRIFRETIHILLESAPRDVDVEAVAADLRNVPGVRGLHDLHVWSINQRMRALSAHVLVDDVRLSAGAAIQRQINARLRDKYQIAHATLQLECAGCEPDALYCDLEGAPHTHPGKTALHTHG
jgi:cobalt-zinc-cadmium efflux system protein